MQIIYLTRMETCFCLWYIFVEYSKEWRETDYGKTDYEGYFFPEPEICSGNTGG